jgi:hypothetical protein
MGWTKHCDRAGYALHLGEGGPTAIPTAARRGRHCPDPASKPANRLGLMPLVKSAYWTWPETRIDQSGDRSRDFGSSAVSAKANTPL